MNGPVGMSSSRAWSQWQCGDWDGLARAEPDTGSATDLALKAVAALQLNDPLMGRTVLAAALEAKCDRELLTRLLVSGACNAVANAHALMTEPERAQHFFEEALRLVPGPLDPLLAARAREDAELRRLGLPVAMKTTHAGQAGLDERAWIARGVEASPDSVPLLIAAAEHAQRHGHHADAVRYWQRVAAVDGAHMATAHYERLEDAYRQLKSFPLGSPDEERLRGDTDKHKVLSHIHRHLQPRRYLEIGVQFGRSLALATCPAIGVDPMPLVSTPLPDSVRLVRNTSDAYFVEQSDPDELRPLDLAFIDGMHLFEFVLRDFINIERYAGPHTLVLIDDILPGHPAQATRDRRTRAWTGDVWKLLPALRQHRPDLNLLLLDAHPTGVLCVSGFRENDTRLTKAYERIVADWCGDKFPPDEIIERRDAVSSLGPELDGLIASLRKCRE